MLSKKMNMYILVTLILIVVPLMIGCNNSTVATENKMTSNEGDLDIDLDEIDTNVIRVRVIEFPPFYYEYSNQWTGLEVELANALIQEAGYTPEYVSLPWSRALKAMEIGEIDLMMNLVKTPEREAYMNFIGPVRSSRMTLVVHEDYENEIIETIDDLFSVSESLGLPVGLQRDVKYPVELAEILEDEAYTKYMDFTHATKMYPANVKENRLFGFVEDEIAMKYQLVYNPDYDNLALHSFLFSEDDVYIGITKHLEEEKYNKLMVAFDTLKSNGTFSEIIETYQ
jgi:ABC-type amino acid transport substrate-binding protein